MYIYNMSKRIQILSLLCVVFFFGEKTISAQNTASQKHENTLIQPPYLKTGDTVAIVAPSGILKNRTQEIQKAKDLLKSWGLNVVVGKHVFSQNNHFAGTDDERCEDFQNALDNPNISAIWCARGGYGCGRLLPKIDYTLIKKNPKALIGYSDITALLLAVYKKTGLTGFHGPVAASEFTDYTVNHFQKIAMQSEPNFLLHPAEANLTNEDSIFHPKNIVAGKAQGKLIGGNLSLLASLVGTEFSPDFKNKIVFMEDVGEKPYRIDRMLTQLRQGTNLKAAKGIALGVFADCEAEENSLTLLETLTDRLGDLKIPVVYGLSFGHIANQVTLPIGKEAILDADKFTIEIL